ncbi:DUF3014 domain-containing protein [Stenotrophomonas mori]|uniref:DUF3014 domain-containing protein n=1 Tax=Stenotrophomonas mori TaxID=2871096 RepID=A0ABT0SDD8_9GAMM|nr:DUF3014 domain-containing protein [Stenotrophomonas mori]MCL7713334.1 DUF3014 domain-containing protein [Stenotrophomonas mori]
MQNGKTVWPWAVAGVVVLGGAAWWLFRDDLKTVAPPPAVVHEQAPAAAVPATVPAPDPAAAAAPEHPLPLAAAADGGLPPLGDSDARVRDDLSALFPASVLGLLLPDHLIQRLVTHVDNLTEARVPSTALALQAVPGTLQVEEDGAGGTALAAGNAARYAPYVAAFTAADADALAAAYMRLYPLVQEAWRELGHPDGHFNDRLVIVIDHLLRTPELAQPPALERDARGRYRFVDPELQGRSIGQKALLRLDAEQARVVKRQLRAIRQAVTRGGPG